MFVKSLAVIIGMLLIMFSYSVRMTLYTCALILPVSIITSLYVRVARHYAKKYQEGKGLLSAVAGETFGNIRTVKAFAAEELLLHSFEEQNWNTYFLGRTKAVIQSI